MVMSPNDQTVEVGITLVHTHINKEPREKTNCQIEQIEEE